MNIIVTISFALITWVSISQNVNDQKIDIVIDELGNANMNISMEMNASEWQNWQSMYGSNPAALKRSMERGMPQYFLGDFNLEKDEMNRSFNFKVTAFGICDINKKGVWTLNSEKKRPNITELSERKFMLVNVEQQGTSSIQQTTTISFPETAEDIKIEKNAFDQTVFNFKMNNSTASSPLLAYLGGMLILTGGGLFFYQKKAKPSTNTP